MTDHLWKCGQNHCGACCSGGCKGGTLELAQQEIDLLLRFAQTPFLPVARGSDGQTPVFLEDGPEAAEQLGLEILALYRKGLIAVDYDLPLSNFDYTPYAQAYGNGSMALTARGQTVLELLDFQGI